jgi:hypothetical protein
MVRRRTSFTPGLNTFLSKVATPAILLLGILILIYFNFNSVYKAQQVTSSQASGIVAFSQGNFAMRFQENAGIERPALRYSGLDILSYAEWSSTVAVDGDIQELWNTSHGYDVDTAHNQLNSAIKGDGWQLFEVINLVNDHTITVTFEFTATPKVFPAPDLYVFDIAHVITNSAEWYNYHIGTGTFTAQTISGTPTDVTSLQSPGILGTISLAATGADVPAPNVIIQNKATIATTKKSVIDVAQSFFTEYTVKNPSPDRLITLGTETLTYHAGQTATGSPLSNSTVALPGQ